MVTDRRIWRPAKLGEEVGRDPFALIPAISGRVVYVAEDPARFIGAYAPGPEGSFLLILNRNIPEHWPERIAANALAHHLLGHSPNELNTRTTILKPDLCLEMYSDRRWGELFLTGELHRWSEIDPHFCGEIA